MYLSCVLGFTDKMAVIPGLETILNAADLISDVRNAFSKIDSLEKSQKDIADALVRLDARVRELEAGLREARSDIKLEAVKEAQGIVNSVQSGLYSELLKLSVQVNNIASNGNQLTLDRVNPRNDSRMISEER